MRLGGFKTLTVIWVYFVRCLCFITFTLIQWYQCKVIRHDDFFYLKPMGVTDAVDEVDVEPGKPTTAKVGDGIRLALGIITPPFFVLLLSTELMVPRIQDTIFVSWCCFCMYVSMLDFLFGMPNLAKRQPLQSLRWQRRLSRHVGWIDRVIGLLSLSAISFNGEF